MRIAIVDDRREDRNRLAALLRLQSVWPEPQTVVTMQFASGEGFLAAHSTGTYDMVFLDIFMDGMSGIETAQQLRRRDACIRLIFLTTSNEFACESYQVRADGYLLKPCSEQALGALLARLCTPEPKRAYLTLPDGRLLAPGMIRYTTFAGHYVTVFLSNGQSLRVRMTQSAFAALLLPQGEFVACNQGSLVNLRYVEKLEPDRFRMKHGGFVPVSRRKAAEVKKLYFDFMIRQMEEETC